MDPETPIACSKCMEIPYDILMMNCGHNLCVKCAAQRKRNQSINNMTKSVTKKNSLICEFCSSKTALDNESVSELDKIIENKSASSKLQFMSKSSFGTSAKRAQTPMNSRKVTSRVQALNHQTPRKRERENENQCEIHVEEPVMYFCLTCKCACFCAECVLTGRHQDHQVKTIKKAYQILEEEFQNVAKDTKNHIKALYLEKKSIVDGINSSKNKTDALKKQIQKAFDEVRALIRQKQQLLMKHIDKKMKSILDESNGKNKIELQKQIAEQQGFIKKYEQRMKKGEIHMLNYYACQWRQVQENEKTQHLDKKDTNNTFTESLHEYVNKIKEQLQKIESPDQKKSEQ